MNYKLILLVCIVFILDSAIYALVKEPLKIQQRKINWGYANMASERNIDIIVIHSTFNTLTADSFSVDGVLEQFRKYKVASHYLISRNGEIIQIVDDNDIAFHAGNSILKVDGRRNLNRSSIGIEIINTINSSPNEEQYNALAELVKMLKDKYKIKHIVGHNDIAPGRKTDPWNFNWDYFSTLIENN